MAQRVPTSEIFWLEECPRQNPTFQSRGAFDDEVHEVWRSCDGLTPVTEFAQVSGLSDRRTLEVLVALRDSGAILLRGESPEDVADLVADWDQTWLKTASGRFGVKAKPTASGSGKVKRRSLATGRMDLGSLTEEEEDAASEEVDLSAAEKRRAIAMRRIVERGTREEILGVEPGANKKQLRAAYRDRSKEFHPDRHFGRNLGTFGTWLAEIFDAINSARDELNDALSKKSSPGQSSEFQSQSQHADQLFERACQLEGKRDYDEALVLFKAAINVQSKMKYLVHGARCAIRAGDRDQAELFAVQAVESQPKDASALRLLAQVYLKQDRLADAKAVLERAITFATSNDSLHHELRRELTQVTRRLER